MTEYIAQISAAVEVNDGPLQTLKTTFLLSICVFVLFSPCYRSRKSWWDPVAASNMITFLRILVFTEVLSNLMLLYFAIGLGPPIVLHAYTSYGNGDSWIYGYARPLVGILCIGMGTMGDMHAMFRWMCVIGVVHQIIFNALSAFQIGQYIDQVKQLSAPTGDYTLTALNIYYWRDVLSFGLCIWILLLNSLFLSVVGLTNRPFIRYQEIAGGDFDRAAVMREQRGAHKQYLLKKYKSIPIKEEGTGEQGAGKESAEKEPVSKERKEEEKPSIPIMVRISSKQLSSRGVSPRALDVV